MQLVRLKDHKVIRYMKLPRAGEPPKPKNGNVSFINCSSGLRYFIGYENGKIEAYNKKMEPDQKLN